MTDRVDGADFPCEAVNFLLGRIRTYALCSNVYINFFPPLYVHEMVVSPRRLHFLIRVPCSSSVFFSPISWKTLPCHQLRKQSDRAPPRFEEKVANQLMGEDARHGNVPRRLKAACFAITAAISRIWFSCSLSRTCVRLSFVMWKLCAAAWWKTTLLFTCTPFLVYRADAKRVRGASAHVSLVSLEVVCYGPFIS